MILTSSDQACGNEDLVIVVWARTREAAPQVPAYPPSCLEQGELQRQLGTSFQSSSISACSRQRVRQCSRRPLGALACKYVGEVQPSVRPRGRPTPLLRDLADSHAAIAIAAVLSHTGAFQNVEVNEILTQEQIAGVLELADSISQVSRVPGQAVMHDHSS